MRRLAVRCCAPQGPAARRIGRGTGRWRDGLPALLTLVVGLVIVFVVSTVTRSAAQIISPQTGDAWQLIIGPWEDDCDASYTSVAVSPANPNTIFIARNATDHGCGIFKSIDGGATWYARNQGIPRNLFGKPLPITALEIPKGSASTIWAAYSAPDPSWNGGVLISRDEGATWSNASGSNVLGLSQIHTGVLALKAITANIAIASVYGIGLMRTTDVGQKWTTVKTTASGPGPVETFLSVRMSTSNSARVYAAGKSVYSGPSLPCSIVAQDCVDVSGAFAVGPFRSDDSAQTWTGIALSTSGSGDFPPMVTDFAVDPRNADIVYASTTGYGLPTPISPILVPNKGILKSLDAGRSWHPVNRVDNGDDLSRMPIFHLAIDPARPDTIYAAAGFNGAFISVDGGNLWALLPTPLGVNVVGQVFTESGRWFLSTNLGLLQYAPTSNAPPGCINPTAPEDHWRATYFSTQAQNGSAVLVRDEGTGFLEHDWGGGSPNAACVGADNFSARFNRKVTFPSGVQNFTIIADDGVRFWVDGQLKLDKWIDQPATVYTVDVDLTAGAHDLQVEYYENGGGAVIQLRWETVGASSCIGSIAPEDHWRGTYFGTRSLSGNPVLVRDDGTGFLDHNWGSGSPNPACMGADNFSARFNRRVTFPAGTQRFSITADDGVRFWVDGQLKLDRWIDQGATTYTVDVNLVAGAHDLQVEYYEHSGGAVVQLRWDTVAAQADFGVSASPTARTITRGASTSFNLTVQSLNGFSSPVSFFAINLPPGFVPTGTAWSPATATPPAGGAVTSMLTIGTNSGTATGTFTITLRAVSGSLTREVPVTLTIN